MIVKSDVPDACVCLGVDFDPMSLLAALLTNEDGGAIRCEVLPDFETQGL